MTNLLTIKYWFTLKPPPLIPTANKLFITLLVVLVVLIIIAISKKKSSHIYRKFWSKVYNGSITNLIIGLVFLFFNYEMTPFFSARFWLGLWIIGMIIWIVFIIGDLIKIPERKEELKKIDEYHKYLP